MNDNNIKKALENEPVPEQLRPENISNMLSEKAPAKKRSRISVASRITAGAAACAVIAGTAVYAVNKTKPDETRRRRSRVSENTIQTATGEEKAAEHDNDDDGGQTVKVTGNYLSGAENYDQIYTLFKAASDSYDRKYSSGYAMNGLDDAVAEEAADSGGNNDTSPATGYGAAGGKGGGDTETLEFSDTYNQEENVLEADICKTDGKMIYYITNNYDDNWKTSPVLRAVSAEDGSFTSSQTVNVAFDSQQIYGQNDDTSTYVNEMYLYNGMIIVIGNVYAYTSSYYINEQMTFAAVYTAGESPELVDIYYQDGYFSDVRISPDGYMYLITNPYTMSFEYIESSEDIEDYIPTCGLLDDIECIDADDILLPEEGFEESNYLSYSVVCSLDMNTPGQVTLVDSKALAGFTGNVYCSEDNLYTSSGWDESHITRIAIDGGILTPAAETTIPGRIRDQFSMSEYNGYLRVATTNEEYEEHYHRYVDEDWWEDYGWELEDDEEGYTSYDLVKRDNHLYVLDMALNTVGSLDGFGNDEEIKSVNYNGDIAYVVTYEQTDPLFAIDLSDPFAPAMLDELQINGYSTYMQKWSDGLLLGFGVSATDEGVETGIKLTMFDNSDPNDLKAVATYTIERDDPDNWDNYISSEARWERKALLIAPEKNLIGFPLTVDNYSSENMSSVNKFVYLSYEDGQFVLRGELEQQNNDYNDNYKMKRAVYIGDYVYTLSGVKFTAMDIETLSVTDEVVF